MAEVLEYPKRPPSTVLLVGGAGSVGQRIARIIAPALGERLWVGGRDRARATTVADALGAQSRALDVSDPNTFKAALDGIGLVVMCLDTSDLTFAHACVTRGIHYIDITASMQVIERLQCLDDLAQTQGAAVLSSVGLAPGLTNLMAKDCVQQSPDAIASLDIHLLFGLGDHHGPAALEWMVDQLHQPFTMADDPDTPQWSFTKRSTAHFPKPFGPRATYRFNFSDQHTLSKTLGLPKVRTWSTFDPPWMATLLWRLAQLHVLRLTRLRPVRRATVWGLDKLTFGTDGFAMSVEAATIDGQQYRCTATGQAEAHGTAVMTADLIRQCLQTTPEPGVAQLDERYALASYLPSLAAHDILVDSDGPQCTAGARHG